MVQWVERQKPAVLYGGALLLGFVLLTGSITLLTWMAHSERERTTQTAQKSGGGESVSQERISRGQQDEPPSEIAEGSGTPKETVEATTSSVVEERGEAKAYADTSPAQVGCVAGVAPEATTGLLVATSRVECANPPAPLPVAPSQDKALPQAGGAEVSSLLALAAGSLLVGGGLLVLRFTR
jgi:LPXTG-motif cell wall-anchored protein